ncbi:hypothetical protein BGX20_006836 [Mortierella sp. AD010]|nr:hypothetical protein BGX20_006836 [Mortierella sp. AD010]
MFLALRSMPNHTAARQELINAAVALDRKFSAEKGLPRVFTGKTPMNSASACLTNNGDKYFVPFKPEGSKSTHFRLAYAPGDFDTAVKEYNKWMEKLIKHDWPLCFGVPKEGALPIHVLEHQEQSRKASEQTNPKLLADQPLSAAVTTDATAAVSVTNTDTTIEAGVNNSPTTTLEETMSVNNDSSLPESRKRSPEVQETELDDDARSVKKIRAELDSEMISGQSNGESTHSRDQDSNQNQDIKVAEKLKNLELKSVGGAVSPLSSAPTPSMSQDSEPSSLTVVTAAAAALAPEKSSRDSTPQANIQKVDEYRLEDLDLTNVPTSLNDVVRVDVSTIPNSGNGLFAKIDLPASTPLGFYFGVPMTENEFDSLKDGVGVASHYSIMYRRTVLDATDENGMPYNDPNGRLYCPFHFMNEDPNGNITFITGSVVNQVICQTNRDVKAGEELFVFYGKEVDRFWEKDGSGSEAGGEPKKGRAGSRSRAASPIRREDPVIDRPRRNNIYKPARYSR